MMLRTEGRKQHLETSINFHGKVMLDLECLECTENGIRFLRSFWPKNENMHGTAARNIIFGRQKAGKRGKLGAQRWEKELLPWPLGLRKWDL